MGKGQGLHAVLSWDKENKTVTCRHCGIVPAYKVRTEKSARCSISVRVRRNLNERNRHHGLTKAQTDAYKKGKTCALCRSEHDLVVDHCHGSGKIRGVLCRICNTAIGRLGDNMEGILCVVKYLEDTDTQDAEARSYPEKLAKEPGQ